MEAVQDSSHSESENPKAEGNDEFNSDSLHSEHFNWRQKNAQ
jgi:hypothetical protein